MDYKELVDSELKQIVNYPPYNKFMIFAGNIYSKYQYNVIPVPKTLQTKVLYIEGYKQNKLRFDIFEPKTCDKNLPALLFVHGGAFSYKASPHHKHLAMLYAEQVHCRVFFPDYHLSPKYPHPAGYEDVLASYKYILTHSAQLKIDSSKIGITGDSAGGMLAAMVCNNCNQNSLPNPCLQMLVYPVTGINLNTESIKKFTDTPIWNSNHNRKMWQYYFNGKEIDYTLSPMHAKIAQLPPTYIETTEYDCLHDDGELYAAKLKTANVDVQLNQTKATFHGYDSALEATITKENVQKRINFLKAHLQTL